MLTTTVSLKDRVLNRSMVLPVAAAIWATVAVWMSSDGARSLLDWAWTIGGAATISVPHVPVQGVLVDRPVLGRQGRQYVAGDADGGLVHLADHTLPDQPYRLRIVSARALLDA